MFGRGCDGPPVHGGDPGHDVGQRFDGRRYLSRTGRRGGPDNRWPVQQVGRGAAWASRSLRSWFAVAARRRRSHRWSCARASFRRTPPRRSPSNSASSSPAAAAAPWSRTPTGARARTLQVFRAAHGANLAFDAWLKQCRPLTQRKSLCTILNLDHLRATVHPREETAGAKAKARSPRAGQSRRSARSPTPARWSSARPTTEPLPQ